MTNVFKQAAEELLSRRVAGTKAPRLDEQYRPNNLEDALEDPIINDRSQER